MTTDHDAHVSTAGHRARPIRLIDRLPWLCPLVGVIAAAVVLGLFGVKLWTAVTVALLISCPLVIAWVLLIDRRQQRFTRKHHE